MKNLLVFLPLLFFFFLGCSEENTQDLENDVIVFEDYDFIQTFIYKGESYDVKFKERPNGDIDPITKVPDVLLNLDKQPELATYVDGDTIYFFDNEKEEFDFFNLDYGALITSREDRNTSLTASSSGISAFNANVRCYEHDNFLGRRIYPTRASHFRNLSEIGMNDKMSSIWRNKNYGADYREDFKVKFYEHSNFRGKSLSGSWDLDANGDFVIRSLRTRTLSRFVFRTKTWADKISSIDVLFYGISTIQ
ncbi:beta/gamma crystallin family protein [Muricauda sp. SCSIO 64092]|uniref:beta/gamma crystallin family protein n=1 Tax=Allomuricauda sp. SCSIO 64092 TaxID=2908842 RepID=UPI001FF537F2|nr:beta/gamma crystallin family protein [Muricauda sp. SCSIO 64092]UOY07676.1 beta/gamma crystallin family protein [Muricauda sp. SCSIO 64092]